MGTLSSAYRYSGQPPTGNVFILLTQKFVEKPERVKPTISGACGISSMSRFCLFCVPIKTFCFPHKVEEVLRDRCVSPKFPSCPFPPRCQLILLLNLPACPLPGRALFKRDLESLGHPQGGNELSLFARKPFATSCGKFRGCSMYFQVSLVSGPFWENGKLIVSLVTKSSLTWGVLLCSPTYALLAGYVLPPPGAGCTQGRPHSSVSCTSLIWSQSVPSSHLPSLKSSLIMPGKGHSVPRSLAKNVTRLAWRGFSLVWALPTNLCRESEKLCSVLPRVAFPHLCSPTREMIPYDSWFHRKNAPNE